MQNNNDEIQTGNGNGKDGNEIVYTVCRYYLSKKMVMESNGLEQ